MADVLPEGFEPDPEGFEPDATPEGFEADPEGFEADVPVAPTESFVVEDTDSSTDAWLARAYRDSAANKASAADPLQNYVTARKTSVPQKLVEMDPRFYYAAHQTQGFDLRRYEERNPDVVDIAKRHPNLASMLVTVDEDNGPLTKLLNKLKDIGTSLDTGPREFVPSEGYAYEGTPKTPEEFEQRRAAREFEAQQAKAKRDAPTPTTKLVTSESEFIRNESGVTAGAAKLANQVGETLAEGKKADRGFDLMRAQLLGAPVDTIRADIDRLEFEALPRYYGEADTLEKAVKGAASTLDLMSNAPANAIIMATLGATAAGAAALAVTKNPAAIGPAMEQGAILGAKAGGSYALAEKSFVREAGGFFLETEGIKTDAGGQLTLEERAGAALVVGGLNTAIELREMAVLAKTLGPIRNLLGVGGKEEVKKLLTSDTKFRRLVADAARQYFLSTGEEALEGGAQQAVQQTAKYVAKSVSDKAWQRGPVLNLPEIIKATEEEGLGALGLGFIGSAMNLTYSGIEVSRMKRDAAKSAVVLELAAQPIVAAAPDVFAEKIAEVTKATGAPITSLHVKSEALARYFQKYEPGEREAEIIEALGADGPAKIAEAERTGNSLEVPLKTVLETYGKSKMAAALADDTATQAGHLTPRELKAGGAERIEAEAKRLAAEENNRTAEQVEVATYEKQIEKDLIASGATETRARDLAVVFREFYKKAAIDSGTSVAEVASVYRVEIGIGNEKTVAELEAEAISDAPASTGEINAYFDKTDEATRAADLYRDDISGLRNRVALDAEYQNGPVALLTLPDIKPVNDNEQGGHDKANDLLSRVAAAIAAAAPDAVRGGTNFILKPEQLEAAQKAAEAVLPEGMRLVGATAENLDKAFDTLDATADALRKTGELPPRGQTKADLSKLGTTDFKTAPTATAITEAELARTKAMHPEQLKAATFYDNSVATGVPGMLSKVGYDRTAPKAFALAMDLRRLKLINTKYGKAFGNLLLRTFAETAMSIGGADIYFAHLSGDEYAAKSDNRAQLEEFTARLEAALRDAGIIATLGGEIVEITPGFRSGIGEKTYGAADRVLNAAKRDEANGSRPLSSEEDDLGRVGGISLFKPERRAEGAGGAGLQTAAPSNAEQGKTGADAAGNRGGVAAETAAASDDASFDPAALDAEIEADVAATKKRREEATAFVERIRTPEKRAKARAWLAFVLGKTERPSGDLAVTRQIERSIAEHGFVDPEGFAFDEKGNSLSVVRRGRKKTQAQPEALRRYSNTGVGGQYDQFRPSARLYQEFTSDKTTAGEAGFHSPSAFGKPGTPENAVAEDMLQELAALPAEQRTSAAIREAWQRSIDPIDWARAPGQVTGSQLADHLELENFERHADKAEEAAGQTLSARQLIESDANPIGDTEWDPTIKQERSAQYWRDVERAVRLALEGDRTLLYQLGNDVAPRGYTEMPEFQAAEQVVKMMFNKSADGSTHLHEMAHAFLNMREHMAMQPGATEATRKWYENTRKAFGLQDGQRFEREQHERFADTFVRWFEKGEAPSKELAPAFRRFVRWLKDIYNQVRGRADDINPEIRAVFESLLATDEAIAEYKRGHGPEAFADAKAAGLTPEQWLEQKFADDDMVDEGSQAAQLAVLQDLKHTNETKWKKEVARRTKAARAEWKTLPAARAQKALEGSSESEADIIAALLTGDAGEQLFPTGAAMLEAAKALRPQDEWAAAQAEAQMAELYPSMLEERTQLNALLENGLRKYNVERILRDQRELGRRAGDEGPGVPLEAYRRAADAIVAKRLTSEVSPAKALRGERTAAKRKAEAAARGNWEAAKRFGEQQLLNQHIHTAMLEARDERDAFESQLTRLGKRSTQEQLGKAGAEYQDAVNFILEALGERESSQSRPITDLPELGEWVQPVRDALAKGNDAMTVADMRLIRDGLQWTADAARDDVTALVDRQRFDKEEVIAKLIAEAKANKKASVESYSSSESTQRSGSVAKDFAISLRNGLLKPETILSWLGGELMGKDWTDSTWFKAISKTFNDANVKSSDMLKSVTAPILELFEKMPAEVRAGFYESIDGKALFPNHAVRSGKNIDPPSTRFELVMMAANYGNPSNRYRLLTGRNISPAQMEKALALLTKPEIDFVNALHAAHETLRPMAFELEFRTKGIRPEGFEATPTTLPNGTLTGGYVPAVYDKRVEASARRNDEEIEEQIKTAAYGVAATKRGHLKSRVDGYYGAIRLDPDGLMAKIHQTVHDISFREAVRSVGGLLFDDRITDLLEQHLGKGGGSVMQDWVKAVASPQEVRGADSMSDFASFAKSFKGNMVFNALAYSLPNFIEDQSNFVTALNGSDIKTTQLASAMARMVASPFETYAAVEAKSDAIRVANDARVREVSKFMKQLKPTFWQKNAITGPLARNKYVAGLFDRIEDNGFALMEWSFKMTATPVFMGRYNQALEAGETEARAVEIADALVRRIFPSHGTINSSSVARNKTFAMLAMFDGFMSSMRNVGFTEGQRIIEGSAKEKARGAGRIVGLILSLGAVSAFLRGRGPDDDESWAHWLLRKSVVTPIDFMVPMLGPAMGAGVDALMSDKPLRARGGYTSDYVQNAYKLAQQAKKTAEGEGDPVKAIEALVRLGAPMTKLPTTQGLRIAKPLFGDEERDAADITSGLIYGESKAKPLNPVNIFSPTRPVPPLLQ